MIGSVRQPSMKTVVNGYVTKEDWKSIGDEDEVSIEKF